MEFEEAKNWSGYWLCFECDFEIPGERFPVADGDGQISYEERVYEE